MCVCLSLSQCIKCCVFVCRNVQECEWLRVYLSPCACAFACVWYLKKKCIKCYWLSRTLYRCSYESSMNCQPGDPLSAKTKNDSHWVTASVSEPTQTGETQWKLNPHIYNSTSHCNEGKIPHNYKPQMSLLLQCNLQIEGFSGREIHAFSLVCCRVIQQLSRPWLLFSQLKWIQWLYNKLPIWENNTDTWLHQGLQQYTCWYQNTIKRIQPKNESEGRSFNFYEEKKTRTDGH